MDTAEIGFFAERSPRFWVSGYCTKWRIQDSFYTTNSRSITPKSSQETEYLASILSDTFVESICHDIGCALGKWILTRGEIYLDFHWVYTSTWWRTLTNGSDVKYVFPRCHCDAWSIPKSRRLLQSKFLHFAGSEIELKNFPNPGLVQ